MTATQLIELLGENKEVSFVLLEDSVRITNKTSKKIKKYFHRNFGNGKPIYKAFLKAGFKGESEISLKIFLDFLEENISKNRINNSIKKIKKIEISDLADIPWEELSVRNRKAKAAVKKFFWEKNIKFLKKYSSFEEVDLSKAPIQGYNLEEYRKFFD
jgi:hypothetical protein